MASKADRADATRRQLMAGAIVVLREHGYAGASARVIAEAAGVNQALVFYHFGTVNELIAAACLANTRARVDNHQDDFARAGSVTELLDVGRRIHEQERDLGNVAVLAQVLAGAQQHPELAGVARESLQLWIGALRAALDPLVERSPLKGLIEADALARLLAAAFIGVELYEGSGSSSDVFEVLRPLCVAADLVVGLNPVVKQALRSQVKSAIRKSARSTR
ncbi:MAG: TetR/AcrR family transcriptional regulator [Tessaracoccus sp.]|uniref:TetR/AcrR family transcriptional regulator n=1 Tax=Tessaracoccus sp. TaxID=1971211 RepID=UPI001ED7C547|nr:TetR/AcrR family transcriptional regulator [Tessaracoccus sp.]MBK7822002.1 TetR/AcrR family transcriptional regulator [Tessaracoccus sp.]